MKKPLAAATFTALILASAAAGPAIADPAAEDTQARQAQGPVNTTGLSPADAPSDLVKSGVNGHSGKIAPTTDRLIVSFKNGTSEATKDRVLQKTEDRTQLDGAAIDRERVDRTTVVKNDRELDRTQQKQVIDDLKKDPAVASAEPDFVVVNGTASYPSTPNDPGWGQQWNMRAIDAPGAWPYATGQGVTIGIADTGTTPHPDLDSKWVQSYDFLSDAWHSRDGNGRDGDATNAGDNTNADGSNTWHGTHVSGIAAARTNNGLGVAGVAPDAKLSMARNMGRDGRGYVSDYADSLMWLAGIDIPGVPHNSSPSAVVNFSEAFDSGTCPGVLQNAVNRDHDRKVPVVVAAGNDAKSTQGVSPANCQGAIVVGATNSSGRLANFSNWGPQVDVLAPGQDVWSTSNTGTFSMGGPSYRYLSGTSMAAPHVAGIVAEMKQRNPDISVEEVRATLRNTGSWMSGYKFVNARNAVSSVREVIRMKGAIKAYYDAHGGSSKFGDPITNEFGLVDGGATENFTGGWGIYWHPGEGAHAVKRGSGIGNAFRAAGYENGIGYPSSDEISAGGYAYQWFHKSWTGQNFLVMWSPRTGAHIIQETGAIGGKWIQDGREQADGLPASEENRGGRGSYWQSFLRADGSAPRTILWAPGVPSSVIKEDGGIAGFWNAQGRENGRLGLPTSDEYPSGDAVRQNFQGGTVEWTRNGPTHLVTGN